MSKIVAYLNFPGTCREAMTFYQQCLGGELNMMGFEHAPNADQLPEAARHGIMHANLVNGPLTLMASDSPLAPVTNGDSVSLSIDCDSAAEADQLFAALSVGATIKMPLADQFWGAKFGMLVDKFGINWLVNYDYKKAE
jgi:PhnB protein